MPTAITLKELMTGIAGRDYRFGPVRNSDRLPGRSEQARARTSCQ